VSLWLRRMTRSWKCRAGADFISRSTQHKTHGIKYGVGNMYGAQARSKQALMNG
jgi:hypothetical protein